MMVPEVRAVLRTLPPGSRVVCAVSGGADSVALLHCLAALQRELGFTLTAAHFNHCLRGAESDGDEAFVRALCGIWSIPLTVGRGDVRQRAAETGESLEEAARHLRYAFLRAQDGYLATAHNADDQVETVLLNLLRGTGLKGLGAMAPREGRILRPLLEVSRADILQYLHQHGLAWREDSSNGEDSALRNRLRHHVIPLLRRENPSLSATVARSTAILRQDEAFLAGETAALLHRAAREGGWNCEILARAPDALRTRALRQLIGGKKPAAVHVAAVEALLTRRNGSTSVDLPGGRVARREYGLLRIESKAAVHGFVPVTLSPGETASLPSLGLRVRLEGPVVLQNKVADASTFALKCDMMEPIPRLTIRPRLTGDRLLGPGGSKSLKRRMIDAKIPAARRDLLPVAADSRGIVAVLGLGCAWDRRALPGDRAWLLTFTSEGRETDD